MRTAGRGLLVGLSLGLASSPTADTHRELTGLLNVLPSKATVFKALAFVAYFVGSVRVVTMINGAKSIDVADIWPEVAKDLTRVSWAHAVNSEQELKTALRDPRVMMIEADVSLGTLIGESTSASPRPIMAHPPSNTSDILLEKFIVRVAEHVIRHKAKKGIKLDFKVTPVLEPAFEALDGVKERVFQIPLWLNADVLPGPGRTSDSLPNPVNPKLFLKLCSENFPTKTLSLGWTTTADGGDYTAAHTDAMAALLKESGVLASGIRVTFPVRAALIGKEGTSATMQRLLDLKESYSLTIWSAATDVGSPPEIARFIKEIGTARVYLDVPAALKRSIREHL